MVPVTAIEAPLSNIEGLEITRLDDLKSLLELPEHGTADRIIAFAAFREDSDFTNAGVMDRVLRVRMGRMSRDSLEVPQAVVVTSQGEILTRYVISSLPTTDERGVCIVTK